MSSKETKNNMEKSISVLNDIKSKYILLKIFENLKVKTFLKIINHNQKLQKKTNVSINNYKNFWYDNQIEIELIISHELEEDTNTFINFNEQDKPYIHIYLNNDKKESKRNYVKKEEASSKIKIILDIQFKMFKKLFNDCKCIQKIKFIKFKRNDITDMNRMFAGCKSNELDVSNFNTENVKDMSEMFLMNNKLSYLNLSSFNTQNVIDMNNMFWLCWSLNEINLSSFKTTNVKNMSQMFNGCSSLKKLNLANFNTENVINMDEMFFGCPSLVELNLNNFNTINVVNISRMFGRCLRLKELDISNFNLDNVEYMENVFEFCRQLEKLNIPNSNSSNILKLKKEFDQIKEKDKSSKNHKLRFQNNLNHNIPQIPQIPQIEFPLDTELL